MEGLKEILSIFEKKKFKIGLATNAPARLIPEVLNKLKVSTYFLSACSSQNETQGKPHPAVYLSTIRKLGVNPLKCIAFEDSLSGVFPQV